MFRTVNNSQLTRFRISNAELKELYTAADIIQELKSRLQWVRHIYRQPKERVLKLAFEDREGWNQVMMTAKTHNQIVVLQDEEIFIEFEERLINLIR